jgi:hypothetical protein
MSSEPVSAALSWAEANQRYLTARLDRVRAALTRHAADTSPAAQADPPPEPVWDLNLPPALDRLAAAFGLSSFERDLLVLCAGVELDAAFAALCREAQGGASAAPSFSLALANLPGAHWSALAPAAPLRYWRLIEVGAAESLTQGTLRIDERILHFLTGTGSLDDRLQGLIEPLARTGDLPPSQATVAERITALWAEPDEVPALVCLWGDDRWGMREVAAAASASLGLTLHLLRAADIPAAAVERGALARLWEREAVLGGCALLIEVDELDPSEAVRAAMVFADRVRSPLLMASREALRAAGRPAVRLDLERPTSDEQRALWLGALGGDAAPLNGHLDRVVTQFRLGAREIRLASAAARRDRLAAQEPGASLWAACRAQSRPRLDDLAQRIATEVGWADLVLPEPQMRTLREILVHVRQRARVYEQWGFGRGTRGLGISALFSGVSGTGKTLAAEVLATELRLDLYRIDLSQVVSKYIGETEKNLRRVFDAAEQGGVVLLFDEADALFGKRSEVKDSHDRYANIEVSYLLQRMEAYRGLAILTTNLRSALDAAFLRRLRFLVAFPFPDAPQRAGIWRRALPLEVPTRGLDFEKLARLNVVGGTIRNIALAAAFLAAEAGEPLGMEHLLEATRGEYAKLERPLGAPEIAGWV